MAGNRRRAGSFAPTIGGAAQAEHQVVPGPRGGHVHQAHVLRVGHQAFPDLQILVARGADAVLFRTDPHFYPPVPAIKQDCIPA